MQEWIYPYLGALLIGISKAGFATGLGMLTTPLIATAVSARLAIGIVLPLLCLADLATLSAFWKKWNMALIRFPMVGAMGGVALGMIFMANISEHFLKVSIGATGLVLTLLLIIRNIWYPTRIYSPSIGQGILVGIAAGFSSTISHGAGPIMAIFLMAQKTEKKVFVATNAIFFTFLNLFKLVPFIYTGLINSTTLARDLRYIPLIPLGVAVGWLANRALPERYFVFIVYFLLIITSIQLLLG